MKIFLKILLFIVTILITNSTFAIEKSSINLEKNPSIFNTEKNIQQAKLMEIEVLSFKNKLQIIQKKYKLNSNKLINNSLNELDKIIYILRKIQTTRVNKDTAENVIKIIISDLKDINLITKNHLKKIKIDLDKKRKKYNELGIKLSNSINKIVNRFTTYYKNKKNITNNDKIIIIYITKLKHNSIDLKNFKNKKLYNISDIKKSLISILKKVKTNILIIKQNLKR